MAPEQAKGNPDQMGPACDIYSLGVILYELLAGRPPFEGDAIAVLSQVLMDTPKPPSKYRADVDRNLEAICLKAMAKRPENRYRKMGELAGALGDYLKATNQPTQDVSAANQPAAEVPLRELLGDIEARPGTTATPDFYIGHLDRRPARIEPRQDFNADDEVAIPRTRLNARGRNRRFSLRLWIAAAAGAAALLLIGIVILVRTKYGMIQIELTDPNAKVEVKVDGDRIDITGLEQPLRLMVGDHNILVQGQDFETYSEPFSVKQGDNPVMKVKLRPKQPAAVTGGGAVPRAAIRTEPIATDKRVETPAEDERKPVVAKEVAKDVPKQRDTPAKQTPPAQTASQATSKRLPRNQWIQLDADTPDAGSWAWTNNQRKTEQEKWQNGVLTLENRAIAFNSMQAKNVIFQAQVRFIEGNNMRLTVRGIHGGRAGIDAVFNKLDDGRTFVAISDTKSAKALGRHNGFFELRLTAIGEKVTMHVNGEKVLEHRETKSLGPGHVGISAWDARGMFKDIKVKILDD
jgi:hypothetical protein